MSTAHDNLAALRTDIVRIVRLETGLHERLAVPIAERILAAMRQRWGGSRVWVPVESADERHASIRALLDCGHSIDDVQQLCGCSRSTVYRAMERRMRAGE